MLLIIITSVSYLLGSIPFGYLLVRIFRRQDIRQSGSGNIGATNVARASPLLGAATLFLDMSKGAIAVLVALTLGRVWDLGNPLPRSEIAGGAALAAFLVIAGHLFPVWLKFRGGKGVATGLGAFLVLAPKTALVALGIFISVVAIFRYVSLASIVAVTSFPVASWLLRDYREELSVLACICAASVMIVLRHRENVRRLLSGAEPRFHLRRP
ncbi:MAG TPA: glycerol-3-phosphate 1-O-acyltransferase PlsY [Terriglobales bacterium]|jgi:glycerol-3-phosphate acyltransferase PlsY